MNLYLIISVICSSIILLVSGIIYKRLSSGLESFIVETDVKRKTAEKEAKQKWKAEGEKFFPADNGKNIPKMEQLAEHGIKVYHESLERILKSKEVLLEKMDGADEKEKAQLKKLLTEIYKQEKEAREAIKNTHRGGRNKKENKNKKTTKRNKKKTRKIRAKQGKTKNKSKNKFKRK
jgi:hypothetical protein